MDEQANKTIRELEDKTKANKYPEDGLTAFFKWAEDNLNRENKRRLDTWYQHWMHSLQ